MIMKGKHGGAFDDGVNAAITTHCRRRRRRVIITITGGLLRPGKEKKVGKLGRRRRRRRPASSAAANLLNDTDHMCFCLQNTKEKQKEQGEKEYVYSWLKGFQHIPLALVARGSRVHCDGN